MLPVFALVSGFLAYTGYFMMYSLSVVSDDEGYWLIALRSYHEHGSLYHNTYSQVGPFYHELWSAVFSVLGMPIDHDLGRALTLGVWVATSLCFGVALWLLTGRLLLGVLAQVTTFLLIDTLINEPMEPAGLAGLLIGILLLGLALIVRRRERLGMAVVGAASVAVLLTKVNIGVFVVGAVCYSILVCWPTRRWQLGRQALGALVLLAVPLVLMSGLIGISWVDRYLCLAALSIVGFIAVVGGVGGREAPRQWFSPRGAAWCLVGALSVAVVSSAIVLANGTSPSELVSGALFSQRNLPRFFSFPLAVSRWELVWAAGCTAAAVLYVIIRRTSILRFRVPAFLAGAIRVAVGLWICVGLVGGVTPRAGVGVTITSSFVLTAPLAWVALLEPGQGSAPPRLEFGRVLVGALAVLVALEAFPTAGSQLRWAGLGLVPVGVLVIHDGIRVLRAREAPRHSPMKAMPSGYRLATLGAGALAAGLVAVLLVGNTQQMKVSYHDLFTANVSTGFPGAQAIHVPPADAENLRGVTNALRAECSTFQSLPGLNSFYFFTGMPPPTDLNALQWMYLFGPETQQRIVDRLRTIPRLCVLEEPSLVAYWQQGQPLPSDAPLLSYISQDFVPFEHVGPYVLLRRPSTPVAPSLKPA